MKYSGIVFDLDGVICFTDRYHYLAWKAVADEIGVPFDETINNRLRGVSRMESLDIILESSPRVCSTAEKLAIATKKNDKYREYLHQMSPMDLADETRETLARLRDMGCMLAIGSSSKNTPLILERIGLAGYFDAIADGNDISRSKPDPEVFLLAATRLGLAPEVCLVVEDADAGVEAATCGGFDSAAIGAACAAGRATYNLRSIQDLAEIVRA